MFTTRITIRDPEEPPRIIKRQHAVRREESNPRDRAVGALQAKEHRHPGDSGGDVGFLRTREPEVCLVNNGTIGARALPARRQKVEPASIGVCDVDQRVHALVGPKPCASGTRQYLSRRRGFVSPSTYEPSAFTQNFHTSYHDLCKGAAAILLITSSVARQSPNEE